MNLNLLQRKLLNAARALRPDDRVPYAFEQRVMARVRGETVTDALTLWARALWRAAAPCAAIMMLFVAWSLVSPEAGGPDSDLDQQLEAAMFASLPTEGEYAW